MEPQELAARRAEVQVVDVRTPDEWADGHIDQALHIPQDDLAGRLDELDRGRPLVTVCHTGARSSDAARFLIDEGFDAESLDGGMAAWNDAGLAVTPPDADRDALQRFGAEFMGLILEVHEHFGDHEPSETEVQAFLRDKMLAEGRSPAEADEVIGRISDHGDGPPG